MSRTSFSGLVEYIARDYEEVKAKMHRAYDYRDLESARHYLEVMQGLAVAIGEIEFYAASSHSWNAMKLARGYSETFNEETRALRKKITDTLVG